MGPEAPPEIHRHLGWWLAWRTAAAGDPVGAAAHLAGLDAEAGGVPRTMIDVTDPVALVRIAIAAGDGDGAARALEVAEAHRRAHPDHVTFAGIAAHASGLCTGDLAALATACECLDAGPRALARASAHEDFGRALVTVGERAQAIEALGRALIGYTDAGATWDAARARRRLRELGVRRRLVPAVRPDRGWEGLTDAEVRVARLVAEGLKNREVAERLFVSPHTVSMHLRHAFTKLDITSRVELTRFVYGQQEAA
jgi:DNA-binding CsgD family transcriptional regulator